MRHEYFTAQATPMAKEYTKMLWLIDNQDNTNKNNKRNNVTLLQTVKSYL